MCKKKTKTVNNRGKKIWGKNINFAQQMHKQAINSAQKGYKMLH